MKPEELDRINRAEEIQRYTENRCEALEKENAELKAQIEEMKRDVMECFGYEYNILVAKLLNKWEVKEK